VDTARFCVIASLTEKKGNGMETIRTGDTRLALAIATLLAIGAVSWGLSLAQPPSEQEGAIEDIFGGEGSSDKPEKPKGTSKPLKDFKGKTKTGG
jgi:hypothetical protein